MAGKIRFEFVGGPAFEVTREKALEMAAALIVGADELVAFETVAWDTVNGEAQLSIGFLENLAACQEATRRAEEG